MQLAVGNIVEGKVTGITKFGAFVELGDGKTGMVHISEVASTYVKEIRDHIQENQVVKVKILSISDDGKVSLSIKKAEPAAPAPERRERTERPDRGERKPRSGGYRNQGWTPKQSSEPQNFEEMMSKFKQTSDDKMSDIKRNMDTKRGTSGKRGGSR